MVLSSFRAEYTISFPLPFFTVPVALDFAEESAATPESGDSAMSVFDPADE